MLPREGGALIRRRLDYRPPAFLVDALDLTFDLDAATTRVTARLEFRRNPEAAPEDALASASSSRARHWPRVGSNWTRAR